MKTFTSFLALATAVHAHYNFPSIISGSTTTPAWQYVRQWTGYYTFNPVTNVASNDIRCNVNGSTAFAPQILSLAAGSTVGFSANPDIYHPGPLLVYMAKVPAGQTAANFDGSGDVWFKIYEEGPIFGGQALKWPTDSTSSSLLYSKILSHLSSPTSTKRYITGATTVSFKIPAATPSGDYLLRVEHIGLHVAQSSGGAQFYISCGQITVTGGGSGTPGPLVSFPGAYKATDPGILLNVYYPVVSDLSCR